MSSWRQVGYRSERCKSRGNQRVTVFTTWTNGVFNLSEGVPFGVDNGILSRGVIRVLCSQGGNGRLSYNLRKEHFCGLYVDDAPVTFV